GEAATAERGPGEHRHCEEAMATEGVITDSGDQVADEPTHAEGDRDEEALPRGAKLRRCPARHVGDAGDVKGAEGECVKKRQEDDERRAIDCSHSYPAHGTRHETE